MNIYKNIKHSGIFKIYKVFLYRGFGYRYESENMYTGEVKPLTNYKNSKNPKSWNFNDFFIVSTR